MAKLQSTYLFTLIRSLTKAEKRHFKIYSTQRVLGEENIYFRLFDAIDLQKTYREDVLRKQKEFRDLSTLKKRLYKAILKSLAVYHSSIGIDMREMLDAIEILFNKALFNHCLRQVRKAKRTARKYELYEEWLETLKWEYRIAVKRSDERRAILEEEKEVLLLLTNQKEYRDLANQFLESYKQFNELRHPRYLQQMKNILSSGLLREEDRALSLNARQNFFDCHALYAGSTGHYEDAYRSNKKIIDLYLSRPEMIHANPASYLLRINNFLLACVGAKQYGEIPLYIPHLERIRNSLRLSAEQATAFFYLYNLLNYYICTGSFAAAKEDIKRIEQELPVHDKHLNQLQQITLYTILAQVYFGQENYKRCLQWLNRILLFGEMKTGPDIECLIRAFHLIAHYEAKSDRELMSSLLRSAQRILDKQERPYSFVAVVFDFFRHDLLAGNGKDNVQGSFSGLKKKLQLLAEDTSGKEALHYFDFMAWVDSKIEGISFAELVRRKTGPVTGKNNTHPLLRS